MGSASRLRDGNQAKKAQLFKVSVFGSHAGPGSAKTDSFLCSPFLGPPPTSSLSGVVAGTGIELGTGYPEFVDHEVDGAFVGRPPPAVTRGVNFPRLWITRSAGGGNIVWSFRE